MVQQWHTEEGSLECSVARVASGSLLTASPWGCSVEWCAPPSFLGAPNEQIQISASSAGLIKKQPTFRVANQHEKRAHVLPFL